MSLCTFVRETEESHGGSHVPDQTWHDACRPQSGARYVYCLSM